MKKRLTFLLLTLLAMSLNAQVSKNVYNDVVTSIIEKSQC